MDELVAQLAPRNDPPRPGNHQRVADPATVGILLVAAQRRIGRHGPAQRVVGVGAGRPDILDARQLLGHRLGAKVARAKQVDAAERPAFLAAAIVGEHQHQRVLTQAGLLEERNQPRQVPVSVVKHAGEGGLQPGKEALFLGAEFGPGPDIVIARRQAVLGGTMPSAFCRAIRRSRSMSQPSANIGS